MPFRILGADRFVSSCLEAIGDPRLRDLPLVGSVDQFADSTDVLANPARAARLRAIYDDDQPLHPLSGDEAVDNGSTPGARARRRV